MQPAHIFQNFLKKLNGPRASILRVTSKRYTADQRGGVQTGYNTLCVDWDIRPKEHQKRQYNNTICTRHKAVTLKNAFHRWDSNSRLLHSRQTLSPTKLPRQLYMYMVYTWSMVHTKEKYEWDWYYNAEPPESMVSLRSCRWGEEHKALPH